MTGDGRRKEALIRPPTVCRPLPAAGVRAEHSRPSKHSLPAPHSTNLKNPSSNSSPYGNPSRTPSTPWRKMTAGFSTCLLSLGCLCVLLAALLECLKRLWQDDATKSSQTFETSSPTIPSFKKRFDES